MTLSLLDRRGCCFAVVESGSVRSTQEALDSFVFDADGFMSSSAFSRCFRRLRGANADDGMCGTCPRGRVLVGYLMFWLNAFDVRLQHGLTRLFRVSLADGLRRQIL